MSEIDKKERGELNQKAETANKEKEGNDMSQDGI
jgi:hypothetical protein